MTASATQTLPKAYAKLVDFEQDDAMSRLVKSGEAPSVGDLIAMHGRMAQRETMEGRESVAKAFDEYSVAYAMQWNMASLVRAESKWIVYSQMSKNVAMGCSTIQQWLRSEHNSTSSMSNEVGVAQRLAAREVLEDMKRYLTPEQLIACLPVY